MKKILIGIYGCGNMAKYLVNFAIDKKVDVVCAFDIDQNKIGKDLGKVLGIKKLGVKIMPSNNADEMLKSIHPDVCIICTKSKMTDVYSIMEICAKNGINAITTSEEAFFPQASKPKLYQKINSQALVNGTTISASGYQDVAWVNVVCCLCGSVVKLNNIKGYSKYNIDDYGVALARHHGVGLTKEQYVDQISIFNDKSDAHIKKMIEDDKLLPSYMWNSCALLASRLNLTIKKQSQKCHPIINTDVIYSKSLERSIQPGQVIGTAAITTITTKEGITITGECIGKIYSPNEVDENKWEINATPTVSITFDRPQTAEMTCATIINRIPDLINSPAGYYTIDQMPYSSYKVWPLEEYLLENEQDLVETEE